VRSWPTPDVPALPRGPDVDAPPLRLWDTASRAVRPLAAGHQVSMYVCGITPYDATHLGHALTYTTFDLLVRVLRDHGHDVRYVQNVTDVDEPLFERAAQTGDTWQALGDREIELFRADNAWLRVLPPSAYVGAVESVPWIAHLVDDLVAAGASYQLDGDSYFPISAAPRLGALSALSHEQMVALSRERGGDPDRPGKHDPVDTVLWLAERPGEPAWESPMGRGRPGWHVECAAIALGHLGEVIDVQGGGEDLVFPHHEMSAAMAEARTGRHPFARHNVHVALLGLDGHKMSKSRGNLIFVHRLREAGEDPAAVRLGLLAQPYRVAWEWTDAHLVTARARLAAWRGAVGAPAGPPAGPVLAEVRRCLADDLDTVGALRVLDRWAEAARVRGGDDPAAPALVRDLADALLGLRL